MKVARSRLQRTQHRREVDQLAGHHVHDFAFERMTVRPLGTHAKRPLKVALDGEICRMQAPLVWSIAPKPLYLMTPAQA